MTDPQYIIILLPLFMITSIPIRMIIKKFNIAFPQNFFLFIMAVIIGIMIATVPSISKYYDGVTNISTQNILTVYLPIVIVSTIYRMDYYIFIRCLPQVIIISTFGVAINACLLGLILKDILHPKWSYTMGVLAALTTVPIQPANIVGMFKELAKYKYLGTMLEAEAIISFIPVHVFFELCLGIVDENFTEWYHYVSLLVRYLLFGLIFGIFMGKISAILMCWLYNDAMCALCVSIGMTYLTYCTAEYLLYVSGTLATVCLICFVAIEKHRFSSEVDSCMYGFWGTLCYMSEIMVLMLMTTELTKQVCKFLILRDIYGTVITYFSANIVRFLSFIVMGPIMHQMTYNVNVKGLMVLGWSGIKGSLNILLMMTLLTNRNTNVMAQAFLMEIMVYSFLSLFINSTSMKLTLQLIGLSELSATRRSNMNNCMKFIMEKRICIINILKLNRYLSDANWSLVRTETIMKHPYKLKISDVNEDDDEDDFMWNSTSAICPDCLKEVPFDISEKEFSEMMKEAQIKILKAKKISIIKQYENGIINKNVLQVLVHTFEIMIESNPKNNTIELKMYTRKNNCMHAFYAFCKYVTKEKIYIPPQSHFKRLCFYIVMHVSYDYILLVVNVGYVAFIFFVSDNYVNKLSLHWFGWSLFLMDFFLKVLGYSTRGLSGFNVYFVSFWNILDFCLLGIDLTNLVMIMVESNHQVFKYIVLVRLSRILYHTKLLFPKLIEVLEYRVDSKICFAYDLATALVNCCDEILDVISQIIDVKAIRDIYQKQIEEEKYLLIKEMEQVQKERPWIAITVKTKQAIRTTLTAMEDALNELKISGFVDNIEYAFIFKEIFEKQKYLRNMKFVQPSPPKVIFNEVPWMAEDEQIIEYLYNHVETISWDAGETICKDGRFSKGVYIVVTGLLRLKYSPKETTLKRLQNFGKIPIVDYLSTLRVDNKLDDNIMSGNSIGELSVLTGRPYDCTITADSPSQAYLLTSDVIKEAMKINNDPVSGLEARMWKCTTINLAVAVLMDIPLYQSFTQEQIKFKLERSFMPNLKCYKMFVVTEMMDDIILLEGLVSDYNSGDVYVAPMLIPRTIQKLILPKSSYITLDENVETRLLIIPMGEAKEYEIMENEEEVAELVSLPSSKCLLHVVQDQQLKRKKTAAKRKVDKGDAIISRDSAYSLNTYLRHSKQPKIIEVLDVGKPLELEPSYDEHKASGPSKYLVQNKVLGRNLSDDESLDK